MSGYDAIDVPSTADLEALKTRNVETNRSPLRHAWKMAVATPVLVLFALAATTMNSSPTTASTASNLQGAAAKAGIAEHGDTSSKPGWYFYKVAYAGKSGATEELLDFMQGYTYGQDCEAVNLGCGGMKITCTYTETDSQVHYVVADKLYSKLAEDDNLGVAGWVDVMTESYGEMENWTPFMHDKVTMLLPSCTNPLDHLSALKSGGYKTMTRRSITGNKTIGHIFTPVGGKIWEFVSELSAGFHEDVWTEFTDDECPASHQVNVDVGLAAPLASTWLGASMASSAITSTKHVSFIKDLTALTNVHTQEFSSDTCEVRSVTMVNHEEAIQSSPIGHAPVEIKFVNNKKYQSTLSGHSIGQFEDYLEAVHHKYLVLPDQDLIEEDRWHHWDHWLDSHVGIKFKNTTGCEDTAMKVNNYLLEGQIPTGKRAINHDGDHYYTGPSGISLSFEYNTECHVFVNKSTDICTCVHENSDKLAKELGLDDSYCDEDNKF